MAHDEVELGLSKARLEQAGDCLRAAKTLLGIEDFKGAANRSYYAVFHGMRAVLALDGIDRKHHSGIITEFRRMYIKTKVFREELSEIIHAQSEYRTSSDYDDFFIISKAEVVEQIENAEIFLSEISAYLQRIYREEK